jgi:mycofactocin system glycosyltransferase
MTSTIRYRLDSSWRRPGDGKVVIAGSPLRLFRLSTGGAQVAAMVEVDEAPDTASVHQLFDRFVEAGALHPVHARSPFTTAQVTVVMPAFGTLPVALPTLIAAGLQVIVVDDASPMPLERLSEDDGTPAPAPGDRVIDRRRATFIRHDTNTGPAGARNTGLAAVTTPLVAFLDSDVEIALDWLAALLPHFADARVALVAPRVAGAPGDTALAAFEQRHSPLDLGAEPARIAAGTRVSYVPAAALVCRTSVIRELGGFDAAMRLGEDVDLVWRLTDAGHRCRYEPESTVHHRPRATVPALLRQRFGYGRSAASLARRHPGALAPVRMSGWSALSWGLFAARRPFLALAVAGGTTAALVRKLDDVPPKEAARLAALGHLAAGRQFAQAIVRVWWPAAALVALCCRRARPALVAALTLPAIADAVRTRSARPLEDLPLLTSEQMAYAAGVWAGVLAEREPGPLAPEFTNWPPRRAGG